MTTFGKQVCISISSTFRDKFVERNQFSSFPIESHKP
jgi:hypothetical protein